MTPSWYNRVFQRRIKLTIDKTKVPADYSDFQFYIDLSLLGSDFWSHVKNGGGDIRITTDDGVTECPREIVSCDVAGSTGEVHTLIPVVETSNDTVIYLYYANPGVSDYAVTEPFGRNAVWAALSECWHMKDLTTSSNEGSKGAYNIIKKAANEPVEIAGKIGKGQDYDGIDDYLHCATQVIDTSADHTYLAWVYWDQTQGVNDRGILDKFQAVTGVHQSGTALTFPATNKLKLKIGDGVLYHQQALQFVTVFPLAQWVFVAGVVGADLIVCQNGVFISTPKTINQVNYTCDFRVGNTHHSNGWLNGKIDEARIYPFALTQNQLTTIYNNQSDPSSFYSCGAEEQDSDITGQMFSFFK